MDQENQKEVVTFDELIQDRQLQMMKAAIPYIGNRNQKTIAFLVKFMELQRAMTIFSSPENTLQMCSAPENEEPLPLQMLSAIQEYCTEKEQETIDTLINYVQMFSAYETLFTG